jgi:hypothetical protein
MMMRAEPTTALHHRAALPASRDFGKSCFCMPFFAGFGRKGTMNLPITVPFATSH